MDGNSELADIAKQLYEALQFRMHHEMGPCLPDDRERKAIRDYESLVERREATSHGKEFDLRVLVMNDGKGFFAQGLEIDYFSGGDTAEETKSNFVEGLLATLELYKETSRSFDGMIIPASAAMWAKFFHSSTKAEEIQAHTVSLSEKEGDTLLLKIYFVNLLKPENYTPAPETIFFFPNGLTAVTDQFGQQMGEFQREHKESIRLLTEAGYDWTKLEVLGNPQEDQIS